MDTQASTETDRINQACWIFMTKAELEPLRLWWEAEVLRTARMPPFGPGVLEAAEGDRARYLEIQRRAWAWARKQGMEPKTTDG